MSIPHVYRTEAVVLKRSDFGEADRLLTLYTPNLGKIRAVAKGVRRTASRMAGHLELFTHSTLLLAKGRSLDLVTQAQTVDAYRPLREDLVRVGYAYYVAELLDQLTEERLDNYPTFSLLLDTLQRLCEAPEPLLAAECFQWQLLDHLGYRPELHRCLECSATVGPLGNRFSATSGGVLCTRCASSEPAAIALEVGTFKLLRLLLRGDYDLAKRVRLNSGLRLQLERIGRSYLQAVLERELKSAAVLKSLLDTSSRTGAGDTLACD